MNYGLKKISTFFLIFTSCFFFLAQSVNAVCPVCTIAVGGGVLLSRYLGVDDLIIGVWVGGLVFSLGLWMATYIKKEFIKGQRWILTLVFWGLTVWGLEKAGFVGHPISKIFGFDKLLLGMILGSIAFLVGYGIDGFMRRHNKKEAGKALFPYQKVVMPLTLLIIMTSVSFLILKIGAK